MYSKASIFVTLGFASVKLRFARHKDCSREPQESPKRAVRELLGSLWEPLGGPWGSLGGLGALLGRRLGSLGPFLKPKRAQHSSRRAQYKPRHWISKNLQKPMFFMFFASYDCPKTAQHLHLRHQESSKRASERPQGALYESQMLVQDFFGFLELS